MKKNFLFTLLTFVAIAVNAQSYVGFLTDNYKGVHGVINNPASIADSPYAVDINLAGASALISNNYYGFEFSEIIGGDFDFDEDAVKFSEENNSLLTNVDVLGPSFMFNLNEKSSLAIFTRARAFLNVSGINANQLEELSDSIEDSNAFNFIENSTYGTINTWGEIGATYAREIINKDEHYIKGGITLKYLMGFANSYLSMENIDINYDGDESVVADGTFNYGYSSLLENDFESIEDVDFEIDGSGFGADLGFIYEWRPDYKNYATSDPNKYKVKAGLSITDIGFINYDGIEENYNLNGIDVDADEFDAIENIEDFRETFSNVLSPSVSAENAILPTALHANVDYNINQKFYLNLNGDIALAGKENINRNSIANMVSLTPRFECKWLTFQMPLSVQQYSGFLWGAGLRAGPLYVGSGTIVSSLFNDELKSADIYAGLKVPIYKSQPKDKDGDGIMNKEDDCPNEPGPADNNGCPWGDADNDGVTDNEDKCPNEVGPTENNGCPWGDTDGDGLKDNVDECPDEAGEESNNGCPNVDADGDSVLDKEDNCPNEAGPAENNGCPWKDTDGDGITDNVDNCPTTAGTAANNGCPEVTQEVQKTLNSYAKTILFDTGKSTIKEQSNQVLNDIVGILKEYSNANFIIEGHTDSVGSSALNQNLSDSRAAAVKIFLIENGIDQSRLNSVGYGEDKPISSNATREGRAQNRRVEINLVN